MRDAGGLHTVRRREILTGGVAAAAFAAPAGAGEGSIPPLPPRSLLASGAARFWARVRQEQFLLPDWRCFLNHGSLGVAPRRVVHAVSSYMERAAALLVDEYPRWGYETLDAERQEMADFLGCKKDELAFTHNATEAMSMIAAGLDLKAGDQVVITGEEHPSGRAPWHRRAQRDAITIREVGIPHPPRDAAQLAHLVLDAIGPRTRVLSFSAILCTTGVIMPVKEICDAARARGVITVVDGAHVNGQVPCNLSYLGCDYFAGSPHKWLFAPAGCGLLYIREENLGRLWPTITTGGWDGKELKAARFMQVGTNNRALVEGMMAGLRFHKELGPEVVYRRIHELAKLNYGMAKARPYLELLSPADDRLYGGLVTVGFRGADLAPLWKALAERKIWTMISERLRVSTHIHTRPEDLETFYGVLDEVFARKA
jgi:selenocysteine lyase/cysteine desulfurase